MLSKYNKEGIMAHVNHYDVIVIGSGPGGEGAAMGLTKAGLNVAIVEKESSVGGGCTHWGTIPSKALRHAVSRIIEFNSNPLFCRNNTSVHATFSDILDHAKSVIDKQTRLRQGFYDRNSCTLLFGTARFIDNYSIAVMQSDGTEEIYSADKFVIATGSRPYQPNDVDFLHERIYDSDSILSLKHDPRHIIIYGAGVIGCEYASIFRGLGVKTDLINTRDRLLEFLDNEVSDALSYHFWNSGVVIRNDETYEKIEGTEDGVIIHLQSGKKMKADCLLYANGRTGNTDKLNLGAVGLEADSRGQLKVNRNYQTDIEHIYAVGDVIGYPSLASAAYDQGRFVAQAITKGQAENYLIDDIPTGIYTIPEISSVGKTEQELTAAKVPYEVGRSSFKHLARAQIAGKDIGSLKILFHRETKEILGIHCFGERAAEIIHIGQAIMEQKGSANTIEYFVNTTFNYPTMAEAYRVAALNGLNRLF
ncbi:Si-specific NAD(P)(+) transhydrogenase [Vibrio alginolyticus]|jgi:NAD(P) transhydrogenase|uniref:Soluble pyridine nucleotide transhydrogenase n=2 Tax=Vibrio antiquarius (strain Ex25) TaxID=150340 RepID=A0ABM9WT10_VIBAE|nr:MULTISPECIES: Si-specific NAD(P)(+) transhydrogenase [Vibrio]EDN56531.1 soluble pyridine nucleotide transhydrogenase (STH)(NAD(P)(+) transhydrogenase [B-specific]) [Vibrio antiquarius]EGQ7905204.1 Si-specific NAD(P)(+) transhydrogenase [Vibrio alginolyticus]EHA1101063.1 Si-specific NAD(P)(+) transhydrogenase [Vibrio alginolyticus]EHA1123157.1 Si-specific NAD(P)(+) transhydrogenase [Vibrio alginolyticus]EHI5142265.1 Si-specific NAD(P)(+) transhydrogenase [Vibrio alginolyticus]